MVEVTLSEVLRAFSPAFKSLDVRIVAVKLNGKWRNVITSIFPSWKSPEEVKSEQQQIKEMLKNTGNFRIFLLCSFFKDYVSLFDQLEKGEIVVHGRAKIIFGEFDVYGLKVDQFYLRAPDFVKEVKEWKLVGSKATARKDDGIWPIVESQNDSARLLGFEDAYEFINETLRIKGFNRKKPEALIIGIPVPARIVKASFSNSTLKVKSKKHFLLNDLQLNVSLERVDSRNYFGNVWRNVAYVNKCKRLSESDFCFVKDSIQVPNPRPDDTIKVELIHRKAPTLTMDKTRLRVPLENAVEPFAKSLFRFCPVDEYEKRLFTPEQYKKSSKVFEDAVAWLLALIGFSVAQLRNFEKLKVRETGYERGSIDIIAHRENECVLLIDCDTSVPDDKKLGYLDEVRNYISSFITDKHRLPRVISVLISPREYSEPSNDLNLRIVGRFQIERIFAEAMKGNSDEARGILGCW